MSRHTHQSEIGIGTWNIKSGGFSSYNPSLPAPEREHAIQAVVNHLHDNNRVDTLSLTDAHRWDQIYGGNQGIAAHLGYKEAHFTPLEDDRLSRDFGAGIGIVLATDQRIEQAKELDLSTRQGLGVILDIGSYGLQVANVYMDDLSEETRLTQLRALQSELEPDMPTILIGDFNALRPTMRGASIRIRTKDMAVRSLAHTLSAHKPLGMTVRGMNQRQAVPLIESFGFKDADSAQKRPTAPARLPIFGVDYIFHNEKVAVDEVTTVPIKYESDHLPLIARARVINT